MDMHDTAQKRNRILRELSFYIINALQGLGISAAAAAILLLFYGTGRIEYHGEIAAMLMTVCVLYPWYLLLAGGMVVFFLSVSYFQIYFSVLLSMNVTRRSAVRGIYLSIAGLITGLVLLSGLIWKLLPDGGMSEFLSLLPLCAGVLLASGALVLAGSASGRRWGVRGGFLFFGIFAGAAFAAGFLLAQSGPEAVSAVLPAGGISWAAAGAGLALYLVSGIFSSRIMRRQEVRV